MLGQPHTTEIGGTRDWTQVRLATKVPANTSYVMVYLEIRGIGTVWFDDVQLTGTPAKPRGKLTMPLVTTSAFELECAAGFKPTRYRRATVIALPTGTDRGTAKMVFWGESARYDVSVFCTNPRGAKATLSLSINGVAAPQWELVPIAPKPRRTPMHKKVFRGLDIQRYSRLVLEAVADGRDRCRIHKVAFTPVGRFQGKFLPPATLRVPPTLRLYAKPSDQARGRNMLPDYITHECAQVFEARKAELAKLKTPAQWAERQRRTRARIDEFFGEFGPKCPLKARITGKLDRPDYIIEKLIFESQPGYHCTANVYVPKRRKFPLPGVLFTCGHATTGKAYHLYHECCLGLVLKGYVVIGLDPTGQGERSEYFDPKTGKPLVALTVTQHYYLSRPSWLVGRSLAGYRAWDCLRAVDYLVTRPEVDANKVCVVGNSGGGITALLAAAYDERIKVCAAAHPGGPMENMWLNGQRNAEADVLGLIPPRPCVMVVGKISGEIGGHQRKLDDMMPFYKGLGVGAEYGQMAIVHGVHNMKKPKREACYAWLNKWLNREEEGTEEPPLKPETVEALHCSKTGFVIRDLGGETGQTLNAKLGDKLRPPRPVPADRKALDAQRTKLKAAVARRIGLKLPAERTAPQCTTHGIVDGEAFTAEKLAIQAEERITLPALLLTPKTPRPGTPLVVHAAQLGKPTRLSSRSVAFELVRKGYTVLSVDVRGVGETDPRVHAALRPVNTFDHQQFRFDASAIRAVQLGTTLLAMRVRDIVCVLDYAASRKELAGRPVALVGEGIGGLWALATAAFDARPVAVACVGMVPSYKLIIGSQYYQVRDYHWLNGALKDFDIPDLVGMAAPRPVLLLDSADAMLEPLAAGECGKRCAWAQGVFGLLGAPKHLAVAQTPHGDVAEVAERVVAHLGQLGR